MEDWQERKMRQAELESQERIAAALFAISDSLDNIAEAIQNAS